MGKLSLLPLAKMVEDTELLSDEYSKNGFRIIMPPIIYAILLIIVIAGMFIKPVFGIFMLGMAFFMASLDSNVTVKHNRKVVENNFHNRFPFFISGLTIMVFVIAAIAADTGKKGAETVFHATKASTAILKIYAAALAALLICRFFRLIAATIASSARKKRCTCQIFAEYIVPDTPGIKHIFRYEFEGTSYWFVYKSSLYDEVQDIEIYIDPDAPELFYWNVMLDRYAKDLKKFISNFLILSLITAIIWVPVVWVYVITPLLVEKW